MNNVSSGLPLSRPPGMVNPPGMMINRPPAPPNNFQPRPPQPFVQPRPGQGMFGRGPQNPGIMGSRPPGMIPPTGSPQQGMMPRAPAPGLLNNPRMPMPNMAPARNEWDNRPQNPIVNNFNPPNNMMGSNPNIAMMNQRNNMPNNQMQPFNFGPNQNGMMNQGFNNGPNGQFGFGQTGNPNMMQPHMGQAGMMLPTGPGPMPMQNPGQQMNPMMNPHMQDPYAYRQPSAPTSQMIPPGMAPSHMPIGSSAPLGPKISDVEFQETLEKNRIISSSAISRAVQDAAIGNCSCLFLKSETKFHYYFSA